MLHKTDSMARILEVNISKIEKRTPSLHEASYFLLALAEGGGWPFTKGPYGASHEEELERLSSLYGNLARVLPRAVEERKVAKLPEPHSFVNDVWSGSKRKEDLPYIKARFALLARQASEISENLARVAEIIREEQKQYEMR